MSNYGVATDYEQSEKSKRSYIDVWSGSFFGVWEARGVSLPSNNGYMLTTYNDEKVRVECPAPRDNDNYEAVDKAIGEALNAHHEKRGDFCLVSA